MVTTNTLPPEIRASIHQDAIQRVSRFFNATTKGCLDELLQNSRRSGATRVEITLRNNTLTISDDGNGVRDPQALLAFGLSTWDDDTALREDPAGMGIYALARKEDVTIRSRTKDQERAWQVQLDRDHFTGAKAAPVTLLDEPAETGTTVSFRDPEAKDDYIMAAAQYYPLPVRLNGDRIFQRDFLKNCFPHRRMARSPDRRHHREEQVSLSTQPQLPRRHPERRVHRLPGHRGHHLGGPGGRRQLPRARTNPAHTQVARPERLPQGTQQGLPRRHNTGPS